MSTLTEPLNLIILGGGAVALLVVLIWQMRKRAAGKQEKVDPELKRLLDRKDYEGAARLEQKNGHLDMALEYFLRADKTDQAAGVARQMGQARQAAELYEKCEDYKQAEEMFREAGVVLKADEMKAQIKPDELSPELVATADDMVTPPGDPGAAAPLLAERGEHERAAELYEDAGQRERALAAWVEWSTEAEDPLARLDQVRRLGDDAVITLLEVISERKPPSKENLDLHLRIADAFEECKRHDSAFRLLKRLSRVDSESKEIQQRLGQVREAIARAASEEEGAGDEDVHDEEAVDLPQAGGDDDSVDSGDLLDLEDVDQKGSADLELDLEGAGASETVDLQLGLEDGGASETVDLQLGLEDAGASETVDLQLGWEAGGADESESAEIDPDENLPSVPEVHIAATREVPDLAAAARLHDEDLGGGSKEEDEPSSEMERPPRPGQRRFEVTLRYAHDEVAEAARRGPGVEELQAKLKQPSDESEVDLLFQLGLAQQVAGRWAAARRAFEKVEKVQPDFGDAAERARELSQWEQQVPQSMVDASQADGQQQRYRLMGELGRGSMAVVFRAQDEVLGREVALKFISEEVVAQQAALEMFQREVRASAQLNHPNIVTIHDVGALGGQAFICMEMVEGRPVNDIIAQQGRLKVLDTLEIIEKVLSALEYAHSKQIIHLDIKPSNIICGENGLVKLMDFGLAKSIAEGTKATMVAGTPNYMAPEQFTGNDVNASTDLFAVGATMYEMLSGESPFSGVQRDNPARLVNEVNPKVPHVLGMLIQRALEFDQSKRMNQAAAMLKPVRKILSSVGHFIQKRATEETLAAVRRATSSGNRPVATAKPLTMDEPETGSSGNRPAVPARPSTMDQSEAVDGKPSALADLASQENRIGPSGTIRDGEERKK